MVRVILVVLAYPELATVDRERIERLRREHDPQRVGVVDPHLTLVFPTARLLQGALGQHVRSHANEIGPITLSLDRIDVVEDDSGSFFHTLLVPSVGFEQVVALHDALYRPPLDSELRCDIAYVPHVGVGTGSRAAMAGLAEQLEGQGIIIGARLTALTIASYDGAKVLDLETVPLVPRKTLAADRASLPLPDLGEPAT